MHLINKLAHGPFCTACPGLGTNLPRVRLVADNMLSPNQIIIQLPTNVQDPTINTKSLALLNNKAQINN